jgi:riboflavin kinase/FMN adenylyltransferase
MRVVHDLTQVPLLLGKARGYATIGVFDGVHRGHQRLVSGMAKAAHAAEGAAIALAFHPHPAVALGLDPPLPLTTIEERAELLAKLGLDILVIVPLTEELAHTPATGFVELLIRYLRIAELWGGPDFAIGYRREGTLAVLKRLGAERGFAVRVVEPLEWERGLVSSSRVRAALRRGDIPEATDCLGRPYRLTGIVTHGDGRGRAIGVPTANLSLPHERLIPADGIYACLAHTERLGTHRAAVNIGTRPTFDGQTLTIEAHLLDLAADLYEQHLALDVIARLRDEVAFPNTQALMAQMQKDIAQVRDVLGDM